MPDPARVRAMFARIAGRYDLLNRVLSMGIDKRWRSRAVRHAGDVRGRIVVDACCGTGDLSLAFAEARSQGGRGRLHTGNARARRPQAPRGLPFGPVCTRRLPAPARALAHGRGVQRCFRRAQPGGSRRRTARDGARGQGGRACAGAGVSRRPTERFSRGSTVSTSRASCLASAGSCPVTPTRIRIFRARCWPGPRRKSFKRDWSEPGWWSAGSSA